MDRSLRLRIHVQRNGLPENHVLFNVPLANNPTVANLLELVNDTIPLEDADGEWGLDDYVVEVPDKDPRGPGHAFECLHFQPLSGLLDKDDEILIRPLLTIDLKKRRLSGRDQILPGGEHIIDGVPFGRPRLRAPRGRPPVTIAPRKRRRLLNDQDYNLDHDDDPVNEDPADDDYFDQHEQLRNADEEDQLLLTHHGEDAARPTRQVRFVSAPSTCSDDASNDISDVDEDQDQDEDEDQDDDIIGSDAQELANEAADLRRELIEEEEDRPKTRSQSRSRTVASKHQEHPNNPDVSDSGPFEDDPDTDEARLTQDSTPDLALFDKVVAVRAAFNVSHEDAVKLIKYNMDVSKVWRTLEKSLKPRQGLAETMVLATRLELPRQVQIISSPVGNPAEALGDISRIDDDEQAEPSISDEADGSDDFDEVSDDQENYERGATESVSDGITDSSSEYVSARPSPPPDGVDDVDDDSSSSGEDSSGDSEKEHKPAKSTKAQPKQTKKQTRPSILLQEQGDDSSDSSDASDSSSDDENPVTVLNKSRRNRKVVSSDESSSSNSESSSDSEKESVTPVVQNRPAHNTALQEKAPVRPQQPIPRQNDSVPPGQGLTRTQRRNQRRRLQNQFRKAAMQPPSELWDTPDALTKEADLEAKKTALLQTLGTKTSAIAEDPEQAVEDVQMANGVSDAWKQKISYRAVECVQEGVELSEPPFPFVQRWDPQQRWDSQPNRHRGKRKSRADSQFYNETNSYSAKKRRFGQNAEEYLHQGDNATFPANEEDIELDYDDVTFNPDESAMANGYTGQASRTTEDQAVDDLPPLPEDLSSLPVLHADDLKLGMIIAWKQLLCTEATQWQPQLSDYMTASVSEPREGIAHFQVQLAKRDRNFDRNVKRYDEETGQRVYGKFEAPDSDSDEDAPEEADDGIREIFFTEMIEPRIVQQAAESNGTQSSSVDPAADESSENEEPDPAPPQLPELGFEVADSQPKQRGSDKESSGRRAASQDQSGTLDNDHGNEPDSKTTNVDADVTVEASFIPETIHDQANSPVEKVSITEDRRGEISELIHEGGFRQEVRSSIDQSAFLQFGQGSPSRQLEQEYASSVLMSNQMNTPRSNSSSSGPPSEYDAKEPVQNGNPHPPHLDFHPAQPSNIPFLNGFKSPSQQRVSQGAADVEADTFHSAPQTPSPQQMRSDRLMEEDSTRLTTPFGQQSTGKVEYPKLNVSQTTQASDLSGGRQPDPNFITHSDDLGISLPGNSPMMKEFDDDDTALGGDETDVDRPDRGKTPTQHIYNDELQKATLSGTPFKPNQLDAEPSSRPQSAASDRSDSSFPDIKFLSSQVAKTKFREFPAIKTERPSSKDTPADDDLPPQPPQLSQHAEASSSSLAKSWNPPLVAQAATGDQNEVNGIHSGNGKSNNVSFQESISPPALSRTRQTRASLSSQDTSRDNHPTPTKSTGSNKPSGNRLGTRGTKKNKVSGFTIPKGSQVVSLISSSEPEPEPDYTEMYADDSVDDDYLASLPKIQRAAGGKRMAQARPRKRGASVPAAERQEETTTPGWVGGSQGPSRKASGRIGGRWSSAAGF